MYHTQLGEFVDLARASPETPIETEAERSEAGETFAHMPISSPSGRLTKLGGLGMRMFGFEPPHARTASEFGRARRRLAALY
jgi:hypothetical protein